MSALLQELQLSLDKRTESGCVLDENSVAKKLQKLKSSIGDVNDSISITAGILKQKSGSVGESYHFGIFILIFVASYFLSSHKS